MLKADSVNLSEQGITVVSANDTVAEHVDLSGNTISEFKGCLASVRSVNLSGNQLSPGALASAVATLPNVLSFVASGCSVAAFPLSGLSQLTNLQIPGNEVESLTNVQATSAKILDASNNKITSLEGLDQTSSNLEKVNLSGNQLAHFANVNFSLLSVKTLDISGNQVASINSLAKLHALFPKYDFFLFDYDEL